MSSTNGVKKLFLVRKILFQKSFSFHQKQSLYITCQCDSQAQETWQLSPDGVYAISASSAGHEAKFVKLRISLSTRGKAKVLITRYPTSAGRVFIPHFGCVNKHMFKF